jgi:hypothetical protein
MDPFSLHVLAGHTGMNTTRRYIHPNETHIREAMAKAWGRHSFGHTGEKDDPEAASDLSVNDSIKMTYLEPPAGIEPATC